MSASTGTCSFAPQRRAFLAKMSGLACLAGVCALTSPLGAAAFSGEMDAGLNSAEPGDIRDTTSPAAMAITLNTLLMGAALSLEHRTLLRQWLTECATGASRIPAGAPAGWKVGHKTGSGANGTSNDVGILLPPSGTPVILALYLTQCAAAASDRDAILAATTSLLCPAGA